MNPPSPNTERLDFYAKKWERNLPDLPVDGITEADLGWIRDAFVYNELSHQQARILLESSRLLKMWREPPLHACILNPKKPKFWKLFEQFWKDSLTTLPHYKNLPLPPERKEEPPRFVSVQQKGEVLKTCPTYEDDYQCCGLKVLNIAENCSLDCSYCALQVFYPKGEIRITANLKERLEELEKKIPQGERLRICTGEYSDSLHYGNRDGILDALVGFASRNPNVIIELKSKSSNIEYLRNNINSIPKNIVVSWSLNIPSVILHEERGAATLDERLKAARKVADLGLFVGFHFHPMVRCVEAQEEYYKLAERVVNGFSPDEVIWISQGSLNTLRKHRDLLRNNHPDSLLLRHQSCSNTGSKQAYPEKERIQLYKIMNPVLNQWEGKVFRYLCMEGREVTEAVLSRSWSDNETLRQEMDQAVFSKLNVS